MLFLFIVTLLVYIFVCVVLISLILMQEGKGGGLSGVMGASVGETFGFGGASKQVRKYTGICATVFFVLTIVLTFVAEGAFRTTNFVGSDSLPAATATETAPSPGAAPTQSGEAQTITITPAAGDAAVPAESAPVAPAESAPAAPAESAPVTAPTPAS